MAVNAGAQANFGDSVTLASPAFMTYALAPATAATPASPATSSPHRIRSASCSPFRRQHFRRPCLKTCKVCLRSTVGTSMPATRSSVFMKFPASTSNMNGGNVSAVYWYRDWLGADAEVMATYGSQPGQNSWLVSLAAIGPRFRYVGPKGIDFWAHAHDRRNVHHAANALWRAKRCRWSWRAWAWI